MVVLFCMKPLHMVSHSLVRSWFFFAKLYWTIVYLWNVGSTVESFPSLLVMMSSQVMIWVASPFAMIQMLCKRTLVWIHFLATHTWILVFSREQCFELNFIFIIILFPTWLLISFFLFWLNFFNQIFDFVIDLMVLLFYLVRLLRHQVYLLG